MPQDQVQSPVQETTSSTTPQGTQQYPSAQLADPHTFENAARARITALRYSSVANMTKDQKIQNLKNLQNNPTNIKDPYDASANAMYRWTVIGKSPEAQKASPELRQQVAANYYDKEILPLYTAMNKQFGSPIPSKEEWVNNAYSTALKYNIDNAYDNHKWNGVYSAYEDFEQMAKTGMTLLGGIFKLGQAVMKGEAQHSLEPVQEAEQAIAKGGIYEYAKAGTREDPLLHPIVQSLKKQILADSFWHDINPSTSIGQKAVSWAVENAMELPLYVATGGFTEGTVAGLTGKEAAVPLTKLLSRSEIGNTALKLLLNGSEGAMYGYSMSPDEDKTKNMAWGVVMQGILGTVFHFKGKKVKAQEVVPPEVVAKMADLADKAEHATQGYVHGDADKLAEEAMKSMKGVSLAGGRAHLVNVLNAAFGHIAETEGKSRLEVQAQVKADYAKDPAKYKPVYIIAGWIRALLGDRKLSTLSETDKKELFDHLKDKIRKSDYAVQAEPTDVAAQVAETAKTPVGKKVAQDVGAKNYVESNVKAAQKAAKETSTRPLDDALDIVKKRQKATPKIATLKTRTRTTKAGRYVSVSADWNVYAKKAAKAAGFGFDVKKWLDELPHDEFAKDLYDFFYPKELKKAGLDLVESEHVKNMGSENPNLLAFMYNFRDRMPKIFQDKLKDELEGTMKAQQWLNPRALTDPQLEQYALGMRAHVDELLAAEKHIDPNIKGEVGNVYASTYRPIGEPSEYQMELHEEVIEHERELLASMFDGKPEAQKQAMTTYNLFAGTRTEAFLAGKQALRLEQQENIDKLLIESSKGKYVKWEY